MPERVTDFTVMTVELSEASFYRLPDKTQELFRHYAIPKPSKRDTFKFELASYRWPEILASIPPGKALDIKI